MRRQLVRLQKQYIFFTSILWPQKWSPLKPPMFQSTISPSWALSFTKRRNCTIVAIAIANVHRRLGIRRDFRNAYTQSNVAI